MEFYTFLYRVHQQLMTGILIDLIEFLAASANFRHLTAVTGFEGMKYEYHSSIIGTLHLMNKYKQVKVS